MILIQIIFVFVIQDVRQFSPHPLNFKKAQSLLHKNSLDRTEVIGGWHESCICDYYLGGDVTQESHECFI